MERSLSRIVR